MDPILAQTLCIAAAILSVLEAFGTETGASWILRLGLPMWRRRERVQLPGTRNELGLADPGDRDPLLDCRSDAVVIRLSRNEAAVVPCDPIHAALPGLCWTRTTLSPVLFRIRIVATPRGLFAERRVVLRLGFPLLWLSLGSQGWFELGVFSLAFGAGVIFSLAIGQPIARSVGRELARYA